MSKLYRLAILADSKAAALAGLLAQGGARVRRGSSFIGSERLDGATVMTSGVLSASESVDVSLSNSVTLKSLRLRKSVISGSCREASLEDGLDEATVFSDAVDDADADEKWHEPRDSSSCLWISLHKLSFRISTLLH
jgi:hypothetical protein